MRTTTRAWAALVTGALLLVAGAAPASAAPPGAVSSEAGLGIRLLDAPVDRRDDPRAAIYVVDHVAPGTTISRRVEVINGTASPLTARTYAGAAAVEDGAFTGAEDGAPGELVDWTTVGPTSVRLAPGGRAPVQVTIAVPADASPGERYGVVWAQLDGVAAGGVTQVNRVGVRIYLSVGPGGEPASDFTLESLQAGRDDGGRPTVLARVTNTGGRALDMSGELRLSEGPAGLAAGPFPAELGTTLEPGASQAVTVLLDEAIDGGPWLATLALRSGTLERRAQARITFPEGSGARAPAVPARELSLAEDPNVVIPVAVGLVSLLALLLIVVGYLTSRRKARERTAE